MTSGFTRDLPGAQQADIPIDAAKDSEPLKGMSDQDVVSRLSTLVTACEEHASNRYNTIRRQWRLYHEQYDWSKKQAWQSKIPVPRTFATVEQAVALYSAGLVPSENWFRLEDTWMASAGREHALTKLQQGNLKAAGFYEMLRLGLLSGFLGGTIPVKVGVDSRGPLHYPVHLLWDPLDVKMDWSGRNRFIVLESEVDGYTLEQWAEQGLYEESRVEDALKSSWPGDLRTKLNTWDMAMPTHFCQEFWGDLTDDKGKLEMANCTFVVIDKTVLLRKPIENPYGFGSPPIVIGQPLRVPYRVWAAGLIEHVGGLARMMTELANAVMDASLFASVQAYQYDIERVRVADLRRGIYPGKMFGVSNLGAGPGIERFEAGQVPTDALGVINYLDNELQRDTGINESQTGTETPGSRRKTATEVERRHGQSTTIIRTMARDLEMTWLEPLLDMTLSLFAQVTSKNTKALFDPQLVRALGPQWSLTLRALDEELRSEVLSKGMRHEARGISSSIALNEDLQRLLGFAEAAHADPEMWGRVNKRVLLEKVVALHRQSPDELLIPEEEYQQQQQQAAQLAMAARQGQQGQGGWSPPSAQGGPRRGEMRQLPAVAGAR